MRVAVLLGGRSAEREVSLRSGAQVVTALGAAGHHPEPVELDQDCWDTLRGRPWDVAFIALHGRQGEDGAVQGMLELLGLPYTGSGVLASALCMDKARANAVLAGAGLPVPAHEVMAAGAADPAQVERLVAELGLPLVVKPVREGSTIGLTIAADAEGVAQGLVLAGRHDGRVLVQRFVAGTEITVGVLATPEPEALPIIEILYGSELYDYRAKYTPGGSSHVIPARIPGPAAARAREISLTAFALLGCEGMARVDLIVDREGTPWVLEVNTVPGLTELSLLPDAARAAGIALPQLCDRLVRHALARGPR